MGGPVETQYYSRSKELVLGPTVCGNCGSQDDVQDPPSAFTAIWSLVAPQCYLCAAGFKEPNTAKAHPNQGKAADAMKRTLAAKRQQLRAARNQYANITPADGAVPALPAAPEAPAPAGATGSS